MSFLKIVALALFVAFCFAVGQGTNTAAAFATAGFFPGVVVLYLAPLIVAWRRDHRNLAALGVLNVLLGWTLLGWVGALVWAYSSQAPTLVQDAPPGSPSAAPQAAATRAEIERSPLMKRCPFCAEDVRQEAIKCKHCGSDLRGAQPAG